MSILPVLLGVVLQQTPVVEQGPSILMKTSNPIFSNTPDQDSLDKQKIAVQAGTGKLSGSCEAHGSELHLLCPEQGFIVVINIPVAIFVGLLEPSLRESRLPQTPVPF